MAVYSFLAGTTDTSKGVAVAPAGQRRHTTAANPACRQSTLYRWAWWDAFIDLSMAATWGPRAVPRRSS